MIVEVVMGLITCFLCVFVDGGVVLDKVLGETRVLHLS